MVETSVGEFIDDTFSTGNELNYAGIISAQIARVNYFLSRLNETPSYVFTLWTRPDNTHDPFSYKPNIDNFIKSIICLEILLLPKIDNEYKKEISTLNKPIDDQDYMPSINKYKALIGLVKRQDLLPKERRIG